MSIELVVGSIEVGPGEVLRAVGELQQLGKWDPNKAPECSPCPSAAGEFSLELSSINGGDEFKLIKTGPNGVLWEPFEGNRHWPKEVSPGSQVFVRWGERYLEIREVNDETPCLPVRSVSMRERFIFDCEGRIQDHYDMEEKEIGSGGFGVVCKATLRNTSDIRAVKTIAKAKVKDLAELQKEIYINKLLDHPNIIRLFATFMDERNIYLVMELCEGGEVFDRIIEAGHLTERQASILMEQVFRAVNYMHSRNIVHRDLKPENLIMVSKAPIETTLLKVLDFGLSKEFTKGEVLTSLVGTLYYTPPEVLSGRYNEVMDEWSCGVIMYCMLSGEFPFTGKSHKEIVQHIKRGQCNMVGPVWEDVSEIGKDLLLKLLKVDPMQRLTAELALNTDWIRNKDDASFAKPLHADLVENLRVFGQTSRMKQVVLAAVASQLTEVQLEDLRKAFTMLDVNGDGSLSLEEFKAGLAKSDLVIAEDLQAALDEVDTDHDGVVSYSEFITASLDRSLLHRRDVCRKAFQAFDRNNDGKISKEEWKEVLLDETVQKLPGFDASLFNSIDTSHDGEIDFEEFFALVDKSF